MNEHYNRAVEVLRTTPARYSLETIAALLRAHVEATLAVASETNREKRS